MVSRMALATLATTSTPDWSGTAPAASERLRNPSSGEVMLVSAVTSVIAKAPFMVCTERSSGSLTGCGPPAALAASQASMVSRWPATSGLRISNSTGSMAKPVSGVGGTSGPVS